MDSDYELYRTHAQPYRDLEGRLPHNGTDALLIVSGRGMNVSWAQIWSMLSLCVRLKGYTVYVLTTRGQENLNHYFRLLSITPIFYEDILAELHSDLPAGLQEAIAGARSFDAFKELVWQGIPLGEIAMSTHARYKGSGLIDMGDPEYVAAVCQWLRLVWDAVPVAEWIYERYGITMAWFTETFFEEYGAFYHAALTRGINVVRYAGTVRDDAFILQKRPQGYERLHHASLSLEAFERVKQLPDEAITSALAKNFDDRYDNRKWMRAKRNHPKVQPMTVAEARASLGVTPDRKIAVVYSHILYDTIFFHGTDLFKDYATWLVETVREAITNDRVEWFIKVHPSNVWRGELATLLGGRYEEERLIEQNFGSLPPHVHVVPADSHISPLNWMTLADYGITVRGTSGLEMAALGKTVILAGTGRYEGNGFTCDPETEADYRALLRRLPDLPVPTPAQVDLARRYAYGVFVLKPYNLPGLDARVSTSKKTVVSSDDLIYVPRPWSGDGVPPGMADLADFYADRSIIDLMTDWRLLDQPSAVLELVANSPHFDLGATVQEGHSAFQAGDIAHSAQCWRRAVEERPMDLSFLTNLGVCLIRLKRWTEAVDALGRIVVIDKSREWAYFSLGVSFFHLGLLRNAERMWSETLRINPGHAEARHNLMMVQDRRHS